MYIDETATEGNNAPAGIEEEIAEEALHTPSEEIAEEAQDAPSEEIAEEAQDTPPEPVVEVISPPVLDRPRWEILDFWKELQLLHFDLAAFKRRFWFK